MSIKAYWFCSFYIIMVFDYCKWKLVFRRKFRFPENIFVFSCILVHHGSFHFPIELSTHQITWYTSFKSLCVPEAIFFVSVFVLYFSWHLPVSFINLPEILFVLFLMMFLQLLPYVKYFSIFFISCSCFFLKNLFFLFQSIKYKHIHTQPIPTIVWYGELLFLFLHLPLINPWICI